MMALAQLEAGQVGILEEDRPQEVICQELETGEVEVTETDSISSEDMESCLVGTFVVSQVQRPAEGDVDCDKAVEAGAGGPESEEVTGGQPGQNQRVEDVVSRESLQHCHQDPCHA